MLLVFLNWIYIYITAFSMGFAFLKLVKKFFGYELKSILEIVFYGLIIAAVYAQFFSLIGAVGMSAEVILIFACAVVFFVWHNDIKTLVINYFKGKATDKIIVLMLVVIWGYCTSRGYMHYDSDLYHAQSIRWIEEYGIVPGLGNIHVRFAYNSSLFALSALYSMRFIFGQSLHTVNGFIALMLSIEAAKIFRFKRVKAEAFGISDFARTGAVYYLTVIYRDIVSPASDYAIMCVVFFIVIRWLSHLENKEKNAAPYALLCVAGAYAVTLKLTVGLILLLAVKPLYILIKEKRFREIAAYTAMGAAVIAPWIIRTAIISGYLLYPFPSLDVLNVDWKISPSAAALDAAEIKTWGRGLNNASLVDLPINEWFLQWFSALPATGKLFILADLVCVVIFAAMVVLNILSVFNKKKRLKSNAVFWDNMLVLFSVSASYCFWQFSAPLLRYGYAYVLLCIVLTAGIIYKGLARPKSADIFMSAIIWIFIIVKFLSFAGYAYSMLDKPYYVRQQDYGDYDLKTFEVNGVKFYYPASGDRVGYSDFPAIPRKTEIKFRGDVIIDGFRE